MAMPEVQREAILAERAQIAERKTQDYQLRRLLQARAESASTKRKSEADDSTRKSSRQKTTLGGRKFGEASSTIEAYKRQREERKREGGVGESTAQKRRDASAESEDNGASEVEWDDRPMQKDTFRNTTPADFNDFRRVTLSRFFLAEFCFHPGFADRIRDCYVRLPQKSASGSASAYQLVQINGWVLALRSSRS